jgi:hypothetical protein
MDELSTKNYGRVIDYLEWGNMIIMAKLMF